MFEDFTRAERITFCRAMANLIASDRKVTDDERGELEGLIIGAGLSPSDPEVMAAVDKELKSPGSLTEIVKSLQKRELQSALLRMLIEASCSDGEIATEERQKIAEAARAFGLNPSAASELVDWTLQSVRHEKKEREILARLG